MTNSLTPGLALLDQHYQQQVQQGLIPDLFSRYVPTQQAPTPNLGGALGGNFGPPPTNLAPAPTPPPTTPPGGPGGQGNAPQLALAAQLYQMMQGGPGGFYGRLGGGGPVSPNALPGLGAGYSSLTDPAIQALFSPQSAWNPAMGFQQGTLTPQNWQQYRVGVGRPNPMGRQKFAPAPDVFENAITALRLMLGI